MIPSESATTINAHCLNLFFFQTAASVIMTSTVYYRFKSQKGEAKVAFDGAGISVAGLKNEIALSNNLKPTDSDLLIFDASDKGKL